MAKAKYTEGKDGYYQTKVWDGTYTEVGKKKQVTLRTKVSSRHLEALVNEHKEKLKNRTLVKLTDISFLSYARSWKDIYKATKEGNTKAMYERIIEKHLFVLASVRLQDISRIHYQLVINNADGHPRTQQQIQLTFKQVIKSAMADKLLPANALDDIFKNVDVIKYTPEEKRPLAIHEKDALFKADLKPEDKVYVYILYGCGLRRGECLALTRFDINLEQKTIRVRNSLAFDTHSSYIKKPKSSNGFRTVPIPAKIFSVVEAYVKKLHREKLFCCQNGNWVTKSSYRNKWERIKKAIQLQTKHPITGLTAHVFRHNYCTNLCYQIPIVSIKKIAELLGDSEKMVIEVYDHILLEKEDAIGAVENAFNF